MYERDLRPVTCSRKPYVAERLYVPSKLFVGTPGEANTSSAVLKAPSAPGFRARGFAALVRESDPPLAEKWHAPTETVRVEESCSSQKRALPSAAFAAVT